MTTESWTDWLEGYAQEWEGTIEAWTDGASTGKVGPGGWGYVLTINGKTILEEMGGSLKTTNQRMEMIAAVMALKQAEGMRGVTFKIHSDSAYLINAMTERWYEKWQTNGWRTGQGEPVKNKEIWEELVLLNENMQIEWIKVKGHVRNAKTLSDMRNATADALAVRAKKEAQRRVGRSK